MEAQVQNLRRWSQLIAMLMFVMPSAAFAENKAYDKALKLAEQEKWSAAHTAFEQAWNADPDPSIAYSWCMAMNDAKDAAKKKVACALVDASKLDPARRKKFEAIYTVPSAKPESNCNNAKGDCIVGDGNTIDKRSVTNNTTNNTTNNDNRQINAETENVRMTASGYGGLGLMLVGAASAVWLVRELDVIDEYNARGRAAQSRAEVEALVEPHNAAQWRGRVALVGALLFGIGGTVLFVSDVLSVETTVKNASVRVSPAFVQVRW